MHRLIATVFLVCLTITCAAESPKDLKPIPDRLVVLTFDDASKSHYTNARPILKQYGFGATFYITEGFDFKTNKTDYMTWEQIRSLHDDGFEIGNHTRDHLAITDETVDRLDEQLIGIEQQCKENGIPKPVTFAWPGNAFTTTALQTLSDHGIQFARRGGAPEHPYEAGKGIAFEPTKDHPLLVPSAGDARPDWTLSKLVEAVKKAKDGRIAVLQFHGVPDTAHNWVSLGQDNFQAYMKYLALNDYHVISMRDLSEYVDATNVPNDPLEVINLRRSKLKRSNSDE